MSFHDWNTWVACGLRRFQRCCSPFATLPHHLLTGIFSVVSLSLLSCCIVWLSVSGELTSEWSGTVVRKGTQENTIKSTTTENNNTRKHKYKHIRTHTHHTPFTSVPFRSSLGVGFLLSPLPLIEDDFLSPRRLSRVRTPASGEKQDTLHK